VSLITSICRVPWAITSDSLRLILSIAARANASPEAVAAQLGRPLENAHVVTVRDGVATIPIDGPIFRHANLLTEVSGATSIEVLAQDLRTALDDPAIRGIVLAIDSPGGEVNGTNEFAAMVRAATKRKPVVAYISHQGTSAAYWIAAGADEIVADETAVVGSVGVVIAVADPAMQEPGEIEFVSSQSPNKRPDLRSKEGKAQFQTLADDTAAVFITRVAEYRGVSPETVIEKYGGGGVMVGRAAKDAGMIDRFGSYESVHAELSGKTERPLVWVPGGGKHVPASKVPAATSSEGSYMATMMERFWKQFGSMDEDETKVPQAAVTHLTGTVDTTALPPPRTAQDDELARVRKELATERNARAHDNAVAFADSEITSSRAMPAEREALIEAYIQAATDDLTFGASTAVAGASRVEALKQRQAARPAHTLTTEVVPVNDAARAALINTTTTATADKPATPEERKQLLVMTPLGQQAAKANGV
jgi:signal peptide peptidase SppA